MAAGIIAALIGLVPRLRRLASGRIRPHPMSIWDDVKTIAAEPRKIFYILAGPTLAQLLVVITLASVIGGAVQVPSRADRRRRAPGSSRRGGVHPAAIHLLPASYLGLGHSHMDAPPRIRVTKVRS